METHKPNTALSISNYLALTESPVKFVLWASQMSHIFCLWAITNVS